MTRSTGRHTETNLTDYPNTNNTEINLSIIHLTKTIIDAMYKHVPDQKPTTQDG